MCSGGRRDVVCWGCLEHIWNGQIGLDLDPHLEFGFCSDLDLASGLGLAFGPDLVCEL